MKKYNFCFLIQSLILLITLSYIQCSNSFLRNPNNIADMFMVKEKQRKYGPGLMEPVEVNPNPIIYPQKYRRNGKFNINDYIPAMKVQIIIQNLSRPEVFEGNSKGENGKEEPKEEDIKPEEKEEIKDEIKYENIDEDKVENKDEDEEDEDRSEENDNKKEEDKEENKEILNIDEKTLNPATEDNQIKGMNTKNQDELPAADQSKEVVTSK
ncbi:hypothetical protein LUQ84_001416 [Hamiltosporidium tvaerminnensis]|nr:hypothetical protein LUQ84_001416 [Hamiltosporidium tvaerminnensis]